MLVDDMSFGATPGEVIGVLGPNGAGKSTMLRALAGLIPFQGSVALGGRQMTAMTLREQARARVFLAQDGEVHWPLRVQAVVALGRHAFGDADVPSGREAIVRAMKTTNLDSLADTGMEHLSGGERARVMLARALAAETPILLADEPGAQLDPHYHHQVLQALRDYAKMGRIVILVLHDLTMAARLCDRVLVIARGQLQADGPPDVVLTPNLCREVFGINVWRGMAGGQLAIVPLGAATPI